MSAPKTPGLDAGMQCPRTFDEGREQRLSNCRGSGSGEPWPVTLRGVCGQRELRHQQQPAADLPQVEVHPPFGIGEDAVGEHPLEQARRGRGSVAGLDADQREQAAVDRADRLPVHLDMGAADALNESDHRLAAVQAAPQRVKVAFSPAKT